jgi:hypothetical protein
VPLRFHLRYDNLFESVSPGRHWQKLCCFGENGKRDASFTAPLVAPNRHERTAHEAAGAGEQPLLDTPDIPNDPDGDDSVQGDAKDIGHDHPDDGDGPFGNHAEAPGPISVSRAGRTRTQTPRLIESQQQRQSRTQTPRFIESPHQPAAGIVAYVASHESIDPLLYQEDPKIARFELDQIDPDTLHLYEAMKEPDAAAFRTAMTKEMENPTDKQHWEIVRGEQISAGVKVLPATWSMKRKRRIATRRIYKWKARLKVGGYMQQYGIHYWETYSPINRCTNIRLCPALALLFGWSTRQLNVAQAIPQTKVSTDNVRIEFKIRPKDYCLQAVQNICDGKDCFVYTIHQCALFKSSPTSLMGGQSQASVGIFSAHAARDF